MSRERITRLFLSAFVLAVAADLLSLVADVSTGHRIAKPLLMPLLLAYAAGRGAPRLLLAALLCGWGGDVLLLFDAEAAFLAGMGSFAAGHVCYLVLSARHGRRGEGRTPVLLGGGYAVALAVTLALLWNDLPAGMRAPVAAYSLLLTAMAFRAGRFGLHAGVGGALFLLSDTLIATGVAQWPQPPFADLWVMGTYLAAQFLLTKGILRAVAPERRAAAGTARGEARTAV
ncbi:lysoplasmalogenase [Streptomyces sp. GC420]|nr:lysoplasmalogenase [Streptomyces sp. GC420]